MDDMSGDTTASLGEFLSARRSQLRPDDIASLIVGDRRRVSGLRRQEVAQLADVSVDYYTRIEQGRVLSPSADILDALARALRLSHEESQHLHRLAGPRPTGADDHDPQAPVRPMLRTIIDGLGDLPALVMGPTMQVIAWNDGAAALFGDYARRPVEQRNIAWITFMDPASRTLFADWEECARDNVAFLRLAAGRLPHDRGLAALVGELSIRSEEFRQWWAEHPVRDKSSGTKRFVHPVVGRLALRYDTFHSADHAQSLITYAPVEGTGDADALQFLLTLDTGS